MPIDDEAAVDRDGRAYVGQAYSRPDTEQ